MKLYCISGNKKKLDHYQELQKIFSSRLFDIVPKEITTSEIQSVKGEEVVREKMNQIRKQTSMPFIVDDVSLLVGSNAYPGALIKHLLENNNTETIPQFLPDKTPVVVVCYLGYFDGFDSFIFKGELRGETHFDSLDVRAPIQLDTLIFAHGVPLGVVDSTENHRGKAFQELVKHIESVREERERHNVQVAERWSKRANEWQSVREDVASYVNHENGYDRFDTEVNRILPFIFGTAIDVGCGDGAVTRLISSNANIKNIIGMDISSEMIQTATKNTTDSRIRYEVSSFLNTNKRKYHLITSRGVVLSHMHKTDVLPTLIAFAESLETDGFLVFDYISNIDNNDDAGRMQKNQLSKEWILAVLTELGLVNISYNGSETHRVSILVFHKPIPQSVYFATGNATKVLELKNKCKNHIIHLANVDVTEIKSDDIVEIAKDKAMKSYTVLHHPVIVTDGGIFIHALNEFPGPNSKQAAMLLGPKKILALMENEIDRTAIRRNCMVFFDGHNYKICIAEVPLLISHDITTSKYDAYPLDSILIPIHTDNLKKQTYKQMTVTERLMFTELPFFEEFLATL
ncbi:MAG: non-canonical purine NTP pyrophosphatase [Candidatus Moranbacteria bacterium]|nr:non-canonical purine NTP pyrophosphatase [Candidatus Moranbacteria bacterium]MDD3964816.1 non-canonical purine NTP pyrophosphatase [Candidatus Moranbacteria bacterium]